MESSSVLQPAAQPRVPLAIAAYAHRPHLFRPGNRIIPLRAGGEAFPAMLEAIGRARRYVHLETYILRSDRVGHRFSRALIDRARAGVEVRLLYDSAGSIGIDGDFLEELAAAGVEVLEFHPIAPWRWRVGLGWVTRRDHRKILVIDDEVAFTGGLNIGDEYDSLENGGGGWHDVHAQVVGPIVFDLARLFRRGWIYAGGRRYPSPREPFPDGSVGGTHGDALARVIDNKLFRNRWLIRRAYLHAIHEAKHSIRIMNAYFLPDRGVRFALRKAARRGVKISIIVPGISDIPAVLYAGRHLYDRLLACGIRIFEWPERMMHAKTAIVDDVWATIGSYNLDSRSLLYNLEVVVAMLSPATAADLSAQFERDASVCSEVVHSTWNQRSVWRRVRDWFFFQLRSWL